MSSWAGRRGAGTLGEADVGQEVLLGGWVHRVRNHGGLVFLDLRDRSGIVQVTLSPDSPLFGMASDLKPESTVRLEGTVVSRLPEAVNEKIPTGRIEVRPTQVRLLAQAAPPPIRPTDEGEIDEGVRLRYRYLDLRRPRLRRNIELRSRLLASVRSSLSEMGFLEIETPFLTRSTPEGARDFLVPSRLERGSFYALPQSPQLFKQLLMVAGMERYFQVVRCFRDEDLRADRQPEFTQIDVEMSFVDEADVMAMAEKMVTRAATDVAGWEAGAPFMRLTYDEAMARYGSDHPDLRFGLEIADVTNAPVVGRVPFFAEASGRGERVKAIVVPRASHLSRKDVEALGAPLERFGMRLAWAGCEGGAWKGSIAKFFVASDAADLGAAEGDLLLFASGKGVRAAQAMGALRLHVAQVLDRIPKDVHRFVWITDFPLFEWSEDEGRVVSVHHPFTSPRDEDVGKIAESPLDVRAKAYDMVLDGSEVGGGSIRIHDSGLQGKIFATLGLGDEEARSKFGFLLEAFTYGPPPHGGIAFGFDRLAMLLAGEESIREVIAFPKTASGHDPLTGAPAPVGDAQLSELGLRLAPKPPGGGA